MICAEDKRRAECVSVAVGLLGTPYHWNGKYPGTGLDCSGLVTWCLSSVGAIPPTAYPDAAPLKRAAYFRSFYNCDRLWDELEPTDAPLAGDLAFYLDAGSKKRGKRASHVMMCVGDGSVIGASGGDSSTISAARAREQGAKVAAYSTHLYRKDFIGFRRSPF
jgi:cell wall-associated NlpC family hydrolase